MKESHDLTKLSLKKLKAAEKLLTQKKVSFKTFENIRTLVKGLNPQVDKSLASCSKTIKTLRQIQKGQVLELSTKAIKALPEKSEKDKKRKKALLLFLKWWKKLRVEVKRLRKEYERLAKESTSSSQKTLKSGWKIISKIKGPLGLITIVAGGIVLFTSWLNTHSVEIVIKNSRCQPLQPVVSMSISLPGIKLPNQTIPDGGQAIAKVPPLKVLVDGTKKGMIKLTALGFNMQFDLGSEGIDLQLNDQSLLGRKTTINLGKQPQHELVVSCR